MAKIDLDMRQFPTDAEIQKMFDAAPQLKRFAVADAATKAGARVVAKRARQLAPRGSRTGTSAKRSEKQRKEADWETPLWKTIAVVTRRYNRGATSIVGPRWPQGNKAYFNTSPSGRRQFFWGKPTGRTVPQIRNWIVKAFDETRPQQLEAMKRKTKQLLDYIWGKV